MAIGIHGIKKARTLYIIGMVLMIISGYAMITCGCLLFKITSHFPAAKLAMAAALLIIYNVCSIWVYTRLVKTQPSALIHFYLVNKIVRMLFAMCIIIAVCVLGNTGIMAFVISFFLLYIITIIYESVFFVQIEKKINEKSAQ